jgi:MFS family permease
MENDGVHYASRYRWLVLAICLLAFVAYAFAFQSAPPLIGSVKAEFGILSDAEAALMMSIVLLPGIFLSLPAGFLVQKYGARLVGALFLVCVFSGSLVTALAGSFVVLLVGRFLLGVGGAFVLTATPVVVAEWFPEEDLGKAMGIFGINMPLATVIALPTASVLQQMFGWRSPFYLSLIVGIAAAVVYSVGVREGPFSARRVNGETRMAVLNWEMWKVGLVWLFFNAAVLSFIAWAPTLFQEYQNIPGVQASLLTSLLMWSTIFLVPLFGYLSDWTRKRKPFVVTGFVLMTLAFMLIAFTHDVTLFASILLLGISAAMIPPIVSAFPVQILGPKLAGVGFGITGTCLNIGAALSNPAVGLVRDLTQSYTYSMLAMALFSTVGVVMAYALKYNHSHVGAG